MVLGFDSAGTSSSPGARTSPNDQLFKGSDDPIENLGPPTLAHARRDPRQTIAPKDANSTSAVLQTKAKAKTDKKSTGAQSQSDPSLTRLGSGLLSAEDPGPLSLGESRLAMMDGLFFAPSPGQSWSYNPEFRDSTDLAVHLR